MSNTKIDKLMLSETFKSHLGRDFNASIVYRKKKGLYDIKVFSPNQTLGARFAIARGIVHEPSSLDIIGRMVSHAFTNKAWEIL